MSQPTPDLTVVKQRQQQTWSSGDFAVIATPLAIVGELLCEAVDLRAGNRVLDIACGSGTSTIPAARRHCEVTGLDYVPSLLERGRERAIAEGLEIDFIEGDAEALPFADGSFDVVLSTYGIMFAPDQPRAAAEALRVCASGGKIGLDNWTPEGMLGQMFKITGKYAPPPPGLASPVRWGTEQGIHDLLGDEVENISFVRRNLTMRDHSPEHWIERFRTFYGPIHRAFATLDERGQAAYHADLLKVLNTGNRATDGTLAIEAEYLEVVATRR